MRDAGRARAGRYASRAATLILLASIAWIATDDPRFGDEGMFIVVYDAVRRGRLDVIAATGAYWLTDMIGAAWLALAPVGGVISLRIAAMVAYASMALVSYRLLRARDTPWLTPAVLAGLGVALSSGYVYLEYTVLTGAGLLLAGAVIRRGTARAGFGPWTFAGGVLLGGLSFVKVPNVLAFGLTLSPLAFAIVRRRPLRSAWTQCAVVAAGIVTGCAAGAACIWGAGHAGAFLEALQALWNPAAPTPYSSQRLLREAIRAIVLLVAHGTLIAGIAFALARVRQRSAPAAAWLTPVVCGAVALAYTAGPLASGWAYALIAVPAAVCAAIAAGWLPADAEAREQALVALVPLSLVAAGSLALPWPLLLAGPPVIAVGLLYALNAGRWPGRPEGGMLPAALRYAAFLTLLPITLRVTPLAPYVKTLAGAGPVQLPHERRFVSDEPLLRGLHSSRPLMEATDEVLRWTETAVRPGDPLIATNGSPLAIYLTGAVPFISHPYIDLLTADQAVQQLANGLTASGNWPVWIDARFKPAADFVTAPLEGSSFGSSPATRRAVRAYLLGRGYRRGCSNELFILYWPPPVRMGPQSHLPESCAE